ncbi:MAG TPA: PP2C family protein-serine/threonine phosphatase [Candidatus Binatia bacterium]|nr:PP2C family protein-serine/threonine phosphatase [Candidatus Binatia bacterium]
MAAPTQSAGRPPRRPDELTAKVSPIMEWVDRFWRRVTEGMRADELWRSFITDARSSYRLYSKEVEQERMAGVPKAKHFLRLVGRFFWAVLEKLTPARRVILLVALVFLLSPTVNVNWPSHGDEFRAEGLFADAHFWGGLLMCALLIMEVGDRVVMKRDLQIAKEIQTWLLPAASPLIPGLQVAFSTKPANTVAGDYYDVFPRTAADGRTTYVFAMADVAGKSIPAALLMATIQSSLKTLAAAPLTLSELVQRMNVYACSNSQNGRRFTTAFVADYDPATRTMVYVNAGHNPPILRRRSGAIERLQAGGIPLGILETTPYAADSVVFEEGDWLVVFTDGVVEAENINREEYGEQRLLLVVQMGAELASEQLLGNITSDLDRFVGGAPQHDDVTCMLVKSVGSGQ